MRNLPEVKMGCLPEIRYAVMMSVAFDEKFYVRCSILDRDDRGWGSEINYVPRCLVPSLFAFFTNILDNSLAVDSFQFQRKLQ